MSVVNVSSNNNDKLHGDNKCMVGGGKLWKRITRAVDSKRVMDGMRKRSGWIWSFDVLAYVISKYDAIMSEITNALDPPKKKSVFPINIRFGVLCVPSQKTSHPTLISAQIHAQDCRRVDVCINERQRIEFSFGFQRKGVWQWFYWRIEVRCIPSIAQGLLLDRY